MLLDAARREGALALEAAIDGAATRAMDADDNANFRDLVANTLLGFPRQRHRALLESFVRDATPYYTAGCFDPKDIEHAYAENRDDPAWLLRNEPWRSTRPTPSRRVSSAGGKKASRQTTRSTARTTSPSPMSASRRSWAATTPATVAAARSTSAAVSPRMKSPSARRAPIRSETAARPQPRGLSSRDTPQFDAAYGRRAQGIQCVSNRRSETCSVSSVRPSIWKRLSIDRPQCTWSSFANKPSGGAMSTTLRPDFWHRRCSMPRTHLVACIRRWRRTTRATGKPGRHRGWLANRHTVDRNRRRRPTGAPHELAVVAVDELGTRDAGTPFQRALPKPLHRYGHVGAARCGHMAIRLAETHHTARTGPRRNNRSAPFAARL
ncbi:hypothetical protein RLIN73S_02474 [Rhodanobacter lindaniclasticus]